ncbi:hypothetical protein EV356DRAFT_503129 [Viridothelium virens]|uniref:DNA-directed RNA polymerase III subunit n=1 Tax=Viridothelium virens TaxID=1048519 RepID=A0A6A6H7U1_VIRVR|nr:hypothetical protein EV356DRAFT_503129 [Viridothelium virens]
MSRGGQKSTAGKASLVNDHEPQKTIIGGVPVPWDEDPDLEAAPAFDFPHPEKTPRPNPPRRREKEQVAHYRALRDRIRDGPLYTVLGRGVRVGKAPPPAAATFDPFEGQPTYSSQKYRKQRRKVPQLHTRSYVLDFFPEELHSTLDPTRKEGDDRTRPAKEPKLSTRANFKRLKRYEEAASEAHTAGNQDAEEPEERIVPAGEDEEAEERDDELDRQLEDDEFEDAEDDYGDNYFDNGEDDDLGDEGAGDELDGEGG